VDAKRSLALVDCASPWDGDIRPLVHDAALRLIRRYPNTPTNLQEYKNKGFTEFAFHKCLNLKKMFFGEQAKHKPKMPVQKRKAGAGSLTPSEIIYKVKYSMG
jgi:hypothetical protein